MRVVSKPVAASLIEEYIALYMRLSAASGNRILGRYELTMRDVACFAADMTIVELVSDAQWIIRLNGTGHCHSARLDRTGQNALEACSPAERDLRRGIAEHLFAMPCGVSTSLVQTYDEDSTATLQTISLPLLGKNGEKLIVTYGPLVRDIEDPFQEPRPTLQSIAVADHRFVDLGYGIPD